MLLSPVRNTNTNSGFTLIETSVTLALVGVMAAIGIPNFFGMLQKFKTNSAFDQVQGAVKEAQLQAIRMSKTCTLTINQTNKTITTSTTADNGCLLNTITLPDSQNIKTTNGTVSFSWQGNTTSAQTIVVYDKSYEKSKLQSKPRKCLVISIGIGIMRWGNYTGDPTDTPLDSKYCETQQ